MDPPQLSPYIQISLLYLILDREVCVGSSAGDRDESWPAVANGSLTGRLIGMDVIEVPVGDRSNGGGPSVGRTNHKASTTSSLLDM